MNWVADKVSDEIIDPLQDVWKEDIRPLTSEALSVAGTVFGGPVGGAIGGAAGEFIEGGNLQDALRSGAIGAVAGGVLSNFGSVANFASAPIDAIKSAIPALGKVGASGINLLKGAVSQLGDVGGGAVDLLGGLNEVELGDVIGKVGKGAGLLDVLSGVYAGKQTKDAAKDAAQAQIQAMQLAIDEQRAARGELRQDLAPFRQLGIDAVQPLQQAVLGQDFDSRSDRIGGVDNPLLQQAVAERQEHDPSQVLSPELLDNPLLQALQRDVTDRLTARRAAVGKLASGGTARELQDALVPQAINFGLTLDQLQRQSTAGRESLGATIEDLRQREIQNLMGATGIGQASAAQTGAAGMQTASNIGELLGAQGEASALGTLGAARGRAEQVGALSQFGKPVFPIMRTG